MNYSTLATEIKTGPLSTPIQSLIDAGQMQGVANVLNDPTGPAAESQAVTTMAKNDFLKATAIVAIRLSLGLGYDGSALSTTAIAKWTASLEQARAADPRSDIDLSLIASLGDPVADKLLSIDEHASLMPFHTYSRAEVIFGQGTIISSTDVQEALAL